MAKRRNIVGSLQEVAKARGISYHIVREWRRIGMPGKRGRWDLDAIDEWWRGRDEKPAAVMDLDEALAKAKLAYEIARANREKRKNDHEAGVLVERVTTEQEQLKLIKTFVGILERAAMELPTLIWGKRKTRREMSAAVKTWCDARRVELVGDE